MVLGSAAVLTGWYIGFAIAFTVVILVVIEAGIILGLARRIGVQAAKIAISLDDSRINTMALWDVSKVNDSLRAIVDYAGQARVAVGGEK